MGRGNSCPTMWARQTEVVAQRKAVQLTKWASREWDVGPLLALLPLASKENQLLVLGRYTCPHLIIPYVAVCPEKRGELKENAET